MKIKVEQFCALATSPSWQAWLYQFDSEIYSWFIGKIRTSKNCTENREIMQITLDKIKKIDDSGQLLEFLTQRYPHVIVSDEKQRVEDINGVFPGYVQGILTYPHRMIIESPIDALEKRIRKMIRGKLKSDYIIIGNVGYIEYLDNSEKDLVGKIPDKNWLISAYRKRQSNG